MRRGMTVPFLLGREEVGEEGGVDGMRISMMEGEEDYKRTENDKKAEEQRGSEEGRIHTTRGNREGKRKETCMHIEG